MTKVSLSHRVKAFKATELPDHVLFFTLFAVGAIAIWTLKLLHFSQSVATAIPLCLMGVYAFLALYTKRYRSREDKVGDNIYYLGFLYTLVSLSFALFVYNPDGSGATDIITNFGIAIATTIFGLAGRVFFNQIREDPIEYEFEARQSLGQASSELRAHLNDVCIEMSNFKMKTVQIMDEGVAHMTENSRVALAANLERFSSTSTEVIEKIREAFSSFTEHSTRLNEISSRNVEALQALFERIENIEVSPSMLTDKFEPVIDKFAEVAEQSIQQNRDQAKDLAKIRTAIDKTVATSEALKVATELVNAQFETKIEQFNAGVSESVIVAARFRDAMSAATDGLKAEIDAGLETAAVLNTGIEAHRDALKEIRASIQMDMEMAREQKATMAAMLKESQNSVGQVEKSLLSLVRTLAENVSGR